MKKKNGFTLIELLAVIVILAVLLAIAIPAVSNYITSAKKDTFVSTAKEYLDAARKNLTIDDELPVMPEETTIIPISQIELEKGKNKSSYGNPWIDSKSYVVVKNIGTPEKPKYSYTIALQDTAGYCVSLTSEGDIQKDLVKKGSCTITPNVNFKGGVTFTDGKVTFDGSTGYIDAGYAGHNFGENFSFVIRLQIHKLNARQDIFGNWESGGGGIGLDQSNCLYFSYYAVSKSEYQVVTSPSKVSINTWYTIVGTYENKKLNLYIDGKLITSDEIVGDVRFSSLPIFIGASPNGSVSSPEPYLLSNTSVSDALVFDRTLSASEIASQYASDVQVKNSDALLFYYDFK